MNKEKLLIVSAISPFPKTSGGAVRIYNTIKYLSEQFELYFIFFIPQDSILNKEDKAFLAEHTKFYTTFYQKPKKNYLSFINEFQPYWFSDWMNDELKIFLPKVIEKFGIKHIQIEFSQLLYLRNYIPNSVKSIFVAHDVSTVSFWRRLFEEQNPIRILIFFFRWIEIYFYENIYISTFHKVVSMSEVDKNVLEDSFHAKNVLAIPNGIENVNILNKTKTKDIKLGYIGSFNHPPNRTAVLYFIEKIAPLLEKEGIDYSYYIAGDSNIEDLKFIINTSSLSKKESIVILGVVPKTRDFFKLIDILVTPIYSGSGTRIKILEAIGFGRRIISSPVGVEGINITSKLIEIAHTPYEFVSKIKKYKKSIGTTLVSQKELDKFTWQELMNKYPLPF